MAYKARFLFVDDKGDYSEGMDGGVFITNVQPQGSGVVNITWQPDTIGKQVVHTVETDTELVTVTVEWDGVAYGWNGSISVNNVTMTNGQEISTDSRRFVGSVNLDLAGVTEIIALHNNGTGTQIPVIKQGVGPEVTSVIFVNGYPGSQTEVKNNDTFDIEVTFNGSGSVPAEVDLDNYGAMKHSNHTVTWDGNFKAIITGIVDSTSTTVQDLAARVRAKNSFGTYGSYVATDGTGSTDGTNTIKCNDRYPSLSFGSITYSSGLDALKNVETADVTTTMNYLDTIAYTSDGDLTITDPAVDASTKTVTRASGNYNVSSANLFVTANRAANGATSNASTVVSIAHVLPVITVAENATRFQKDLNGKNYTITINSDQLLRAVPTVTAPEGTLGSFSGALPGSTFTATITIYDTDINGTYNWGNLSADNLAGLTQTSITGDDTYEIGGFTERDVYFDPQSVKTSLGTFVSNINKLEALDKDLIPMTFYSDLNDYVRGFSIVDSGGAYDPNGDYVYWNDVAERESNTTGLSFIRIKENV